MEGGRGEVLKSLSKSLSCLCDEVLHIYRHQEMITILFYFGNNWSERK